MSDEIAEKLDLSQKTGKTYCMCFFFLSGIYHFTFDLALILIYVSDLESTLVQLVKPQRN